MVLVGAVNFKRMKRLKSLKFNFESFHNWGIWCLKHSMNSTFWLSLLILFVTIVLSTVAFYEWYSFAFFVGSLFFVHWLGLVATGFIAALIPIYYILKRRKPQKIKTMLKIHVFGNLFSFLLISIHFAQNTGRLAAFSLRLEDGFALFLVLSIIVTTGMLERFGARPKLVRYTKPIHRYAVFVFYFVTLVHVLQGFNII